MRQVDLNTFDEFYLHLDNAFQPWGIHIEAAVSGRLDSVRLQAAAWAAVRAHPMLRAELAPWRATDIRYRWRIADTLDSLPLTTVECRDENELAEARIRLLDHSPRLDQPGPFELLLVHAPGGDRLLLNLNHAAADAMSGVRVVYSILRAYGGEPDVVPSFDPLLARDVRRLLKDGSMTGLVGRARAFVDIARVGTREPCRIVQRGGIDRSGYGFELRRIDVDTMKEAMRRRPAGATVNDLLIGSLAVTMRRWNDKYGGPTGRLSMVMPVNSRPLEWRNEVVGNFAIFTSVNIPESMQSDVLTATTEAARRTSGIKMNRTHGLMRDLLGLLNLLPAALKRWVVREKPLLGGRVADSAVMTNLGRVMPPPVLGGNAGEVTGIWFSSPSHSPNDTALAAVSFGGEMFLSLSYTHTQFDAIAGVEFMDLFEQVLVAG
ncbi:hypothetical protein LTV02_03910 [Nocardia yamanashiensis]|uniref:hypothetical protein n=1 Tax=Nocardia yamanashiensis TaxID=209247 RepID=UPI001E5F441A|nr:hypothetical protein [Nocardia yamanashiensis]UGT42575.1 hypothetical protein LTV02_03910 [Nocardia yamanashiensis]